jgi:hypothetical protein
MSPFPLFAALFFLVNEHLFDQTNFFGKTMENNSNNDHYRKLQFDFGEQNNSEFFSGMLSPSHSNWLQ